MFESPDFRHRMYKLLIDAEPAILPDEARRIVDMLQLLAVENEPELQIRESKKPKDARRLDMVDAMHSVREILRTAHQIALQRSAPKRLPSIVLEDVQRAIQLKFCRIWPFCK